MQLLVADTHFFLLKDRNYPDGHVQSPAWLALEQLASAAFTQLNLSGCCTRGKSHYFVQVLVEVFKSQPTSHEAFAPLQLSEKSDTLQPGIIVL